VLFVAERQGGCMLKQIIYYYEYHSYHTSTQV
jgi:hypothetical protein